MLYVTPTLIWLLHAHIADICAICNGKVLHGTEEVKRLKIFEDSAVDTRVSGDIMSLAFAWKMRF